MLCCRQWEAMVDFWDGQIWTLEKQPWREGWIGERREASREEFCNDDPHKRLKWSELQHRRSQLWGYDEGRPVGIVWDAGKENRFRLKQAALEEGADFSPGATWPPRNKRQCQEPSSQRAAWFLEQAEKMSSQSKVKPQGSCKVAPEPRTEAKWPTSNVSFLNRGPGCYDRGTESTLRASAGLTGSSFLNRAPGQVLQQRTGSEAWLSVGVQHPFLLRPLRTSRRVEENSPRRGLHSVTLGSLGLDGYEQHGLVLSGFSFSFTVIKSGQNKPGWVSPRSPEHAWLRASQQRLHWSL